MKIEVQVTKEEFEAVERIKKIHGDKYSYNVALGIRPLLKNLRKDQSVAAGGDDFHIVLTEVK